MFNVERLRALHALAAHGSVALAASALHVTPSGVSQQLAKLERETGHQLLEQHGRGVRLTAAGHVLAKHASEILSRMSEARSDLEGLSEEILGPLRIGSISTVLRAVVPGALSALHRRHPRLEVTLREGEAEETIPALVRRDLDLAVLESWDRRPAQLPAEVSYRRLCTDTADVALPEQHRLAHRSTVALHELADTPWVSWASDTACHEWLVQTLRSQGFEPRVTCNVAGYPTQLELVAANLAGALVPRLARDSVPAGVAIVRTRPVLQRQVLALWRTDSERPAIRACVDALAAVTEQQTLVAPHDQQ
ncbi:LysR family transcriptional regulator [Actinopolyspora xinjiangensis]|uniref:LysR family transcriptional regulator n=1 Tax=Actinopolyspora xinjiangensis TaxID=405564 RepID=UPI000B86D453|nr:LysR family transcriptional regulator [Actinopolyspora xinjiangensis]